MKLSFNNCNYTRKQSNISFKCKEKVLAKTIEVSPLVENMQEFLLSNKGKHVSIEEISSIFKKYIPDINLSIEDGKVADILNSGVIASSGVKTASDLSKYTSYNMTLHSKSPMDKLKNLLHIKNDKKECYVTGKFVNSLTHESTHIVQVKSKPSLLAYQRTLKATLPSEQWVQGFGFDNAWTYNRLVYKEEIGFDSNRFIKKLMKSIRAPYYMQDNDERAVIQLKQLIREAQAEKQAYEVGNLCELYYRFPKLAQHENVRAIFNKIAIKGADWFKWDDKIEVMKKEYFNLIHSLRQKNAKI